MILSHSIKNTLRSPGKTALFLVLICSLTLLLSLGINLWAAIVQFLDECNDSYTTIALFEYMGAEYPDEAVYDDKMQQAVDDFDFTLITGNENVLLWDRSERALGYIEGFTRTDREIPYKQAAVLIINTVVPYDSYGTYCAIVSDALYSYNDIIGKTILFTPPHYEFERGHSYIVHGEFYRGRTSYKYFMFTPYGNAAAVNAGLDIGSPMIEDITNEDGSITIDPDSIFLKIADTYKMMNNGVSVFAASDIESLFPFHQQLLYITQGRLFTQQEYDGGEHVCIITQTIAEKCGVSVGDEIPLSIAAAGDVPVYESYWAGTGFADESLYRVVGITNINDSMSHYVFIPRRTDLVLSSSQIGYTMGQAVLRNDGADAFYQAVEPLLPDRVRLTIYDQGYSAVAVPFQNILTVVTVVTWICAFVCAAVLAMFGFLFIYRQRDVADTMLKLGAGKARISRYFLYGSGIISLAASVSGCTAGYLLSDYVMGIVKSMAGEITVTNTMYSVSKLTIDKALAFAPDTHYALFLATGAAVLAIALLFSFVFMLLAMKPKNKKSGKVRTPKKPAQSSHLSGGPVKYAILSMLRGGSRTLIVPLVSCIVVVFLCQLAFTTGNYEKQLKDIYHSTVIAGQFTGIDGKQGKALALEFADLAALLNSGYTEKIDATHANKYYYLGIARTADGTELPVDPIVYPKSGFAYETFMATIMLGPDLVLTNNIHKTPEFINSGNVLMEFLDGFNESFLTEYTGDISGCMVSTDFMQQKGIALGDTIGLALPEYNIDYMEFLVVGSYVKQGSKDNIYCPIGAPLTPEMLSGNPAPIPRRGGYVFQSPEALWFISYQSANFSISASDLNGFRSYLHEYGFSEANNYGKVRSFIVLDDMLFNSTVNTLTRQIRLIKILYPFLYFLVGAIGLVVSYLLVVSRRKEFAVMRGLGANKPRTFLSFFIEQALLCLAGCAPGLGGWAAVMGSVSPLQWMLAAGFVLCYFTGSAISISIMNSEKVLAILTEED